MIVYIVLYIHMSVESDFRMNEMSHYPMLRGIESDDITTYIVCSWQLNMVMPSPSSFILHRFACNNKIVDDATDCLFN